MKAAFVVLALAAAASAVSINAINWGEVQKAVNEVESLVKSTVEFVLAEAHKGNPSIAETIKEILYREEHVPAALAILDKVNAEIQAQTLTEASAEGYFDQLEKILASASNEAADSVNQLPSENAENIKKEVSAALQKVFVLAEKIYELLRQ